MQSPLSLLKFLSEGRQHLSFLVHVHQTFADLWKSNANLYRVNQSQRQCSWAGRGGVLNAYLLSENKIGINKWNIEMSECLHNIQPKDKNYKKAWHTATEQKLF